MKYILSVLFVLFMLLPLIISNIFSRELSDESGLPGCFKRAVLWLQKILPTAFLKLFLPSEKTMETALKLDPGVKTEEFAGKYSFKKIKAVYMLLLGASLLLLLYVFFYPSSSLADGRIAREGEKGSERSEQVKAEVDGQEEDLTLSIAPREYSEKDREALFNNVKTYIDSTVAGENDSLDDVKYALHFVTSYPDENVSIDWECEDYNLISQDGSIGDLSEIKLPVQTSVIATIHYSSYTSEYNLPVTITEHIQTDEQSLLDRLNSAIKEADSATRNSKWFILPDSVDGKPIHWSYADGVSPLLLTFIFALALFGVLFLQDEHMKNEVQRRKTLLELDYPLFVHRIVLMLGAGMTVRRSWVLLLRSLLDESDKKGRLSYLGLEMRYSYLQLRSGIPEARVYREFGSRTGLACYEQICQLLIQSISKGRNGIEDMMMQEAAAAQRSRRDAAKRLGETAGTKLLLPMILLMIVVIAIVVSPAIFNM